MRQQLSFKNCFFNKQQMEMNEKLERFDPNFEKIIPNLDEIAHL